MPRIVKSVLTYHRAVAGADEAVVGEVEEEGGVEKTIGSASTRSQNITNDSKDITIRC